MSHRFSGSPRLSLLLPGIFLALAIVLAGCGIAEGSSGKQVDATSIDSSASSVQVVLEDNDALETDNGVKKIQKGNDVTFTLTPSANAAPVSCDYPDYTLEQAGLSSGYTLTLHHVLYDTAVSVQTENVGVPLTAWMNDGTGRSFTWYTNPAHLTQNTPAVSSGSTADDISLERDGYTLIGWSTTPDGHTDIAAPGSRLALLHSSAGSTSSTEMSAQEKTEGTSADISEQEKTEGTSAGMSESGKAADTSAKMSETEKIEGASTEAYQSEKEEDSSAKMSDSEEEVDTSAEIYAIWEPWTNADLFLTQENGSGLTIVGFRDTDSSSAPQNISTLCVPSYIDGKPITVISSGAFEKLSCQKVILPPTLTKIEDHAFEGAQMKELLLFDSLDYVSDLSFSGCSQLQTLHIGAATAPRYSGTYYDTFPDKMDYLVKMHEQVHMRKADGDMEQADTNQTDASHLLVLFSGSSTRFGYDSPAIEAAFPGYYVCNMGVFAYTNALPQLELIRLYMAEGDILLDSPEFDAAKRQFCTTNALDDKFFNMIEGNYDLLSRLDLREYAAVFTSFHQYLTIRRQLPERSYTLWAGDYDEDGNALDGGEESQSHSYNAQGDYIVYRPNADSDEPVYGLPLEYTKKAFPAALYFEPANQELSRFTRNGVRVFLTYAPRNSKALSEDSTAEAIDELDEWIRQNMEVPVISRLSDSLYPGRYLYGTDNHLSTEGVEIRTKKVIQELQAAIYQ